MTRKSFAALLKTSALAFLLFALLFAGGSLGTSHGFIGSILRELTVILDDPETQWMIFLCLGIYFTTFLFLRFRTTPGFWRVNNPSLWLTAMVLISAIFYALNYSPSIDALTLLAGAVLGQAIALWVGFDATKPFPPSAFRLPLLLVSLLVILLALASVWGTDASRTFEYHGHIRWCGPWDNPNIAGLLMGVGILLALGLLVQSLKSNVQSQESKIRIWKLGFRKYVVVILCFSAAILMARGLLQSYSRGAWLALFCGFSYLVFRAMRSSCNPNGKIIQWMRINGITIAIIVCSLALLTFWQFRYAEHKLARRTFSVSNVNDFSLLNRVEAWEGTLQMMVDKLRFGFGWNQPESIYENDYSSPKLEESAAIEMNDYFMLGSSIGLPALFCFGAYVWLSLTGKSEIGNQKSEITEMDWIRIVCRAGAIVLLVGFWFDGGLFKLPTAATFWILLELGSTPTLNRDAV